MWAILDRLRAEGKLVDLERDCLYGVTLRGFVSGLSAELAMLTEVRAGHFDGASIFRVDDVTALRWGGEPLDGWAKLLVETFSSPETAAGVDLSGWEALLGSLAARAPVLTLHREDEGAQSVGLDVALHDGWLEGKALDAAGRVNGGFAFEAWRLTRLHFGGAQERTLWRLAKEHPSGAAVR